MINREFLEKTFKNRLASSCYVDTLNQNLSLYSGNMNLENAFLGKGNNSFPHTMSEEEKIIFNKNLENRIINNENMDIVTINKNLENNVINNENMGVEDVADDYSPLINILDNLPDEFFEPLDLIKRNVPELDNFFAQFGSNYSPKILLDPIPENYEVNNFSSDSQEKECIKSFKNSYKIPNIISSKGSPYFFMDLIKKTTDVRTMKFYISKTGNSNILQYFGINDRWIQQESVRLHKLKNDRDRRIARLKRITLQLIKELKQIDKSDITLEHDLSWMKSVGTVLNDQSILDAINLLSYFF